MEYIGNVLDIELKTLLSNYEEGVNRLVSPIIGNYIHYKVDFKAYIKRYCDSRGIQYDNEIHVFVYSTAGIEYWYFLSIRLVFFPIYKIPFLLSHHLQNYHADESDFLLSVINTVLNLVELNSPIDNTKRLESISDWVQKNEAPLQYSTPIKQQKKNKEEITLVWTAGDEILHSISKRIKYSRHGFINNETEFYNVFKRNKPIEWKSKHNHLIYILFLLYQNELFKPSTGKAYLSVSLKYFGEKASKLGQKNAAHSTLNKINKESSQIYAAIKKDVDAMLLSLISKK